MSRFSGLVTFWRNTGELPLVLRALCRGGMLVAPLFLLMLALPIEWTLDEQQVSSAELWRTGQGIVIACPLALYGIGAWGLAARQHWSRWLLVAASPLSGVVLVLNPATHVGIAMPDVLGGVGLAVLVYIGLFHVRAVQAFFAGR